MIEADETFDGGGKHHDFEANEQAGLPGGAASEVGYLEARASTGFASIRARSGSCPEFGEFAARVHDARQPALLGSFSR